MLPDEDFRTNLEYLLPASTPNPTLWRKVDGKMVMPELQSKFLDEFLLTYKADREYTTMEQWANAHGVAVKTLRTWKKDRRFIAEWSRRADSKNLSVERIQTVMDTIYAAAANGDKDMAKLYLSEVQKMRPPVQQATDDELRDMSDAELDDLLRDLAGE